MSMKLLEVSLSCLHFSLMFSDGEVKSLLFASVASPDLCCITDDYVCIAQSFGIFQLYCGVKYLLQIQQVNMELNEILYISQSCKNPTFNIGNL